MNRSTAQLRDKLGFGREKIVKISEMKIRSTVWHFIHDPVSDEIEHGGKRPLKWG